LDKRIQARDLCGACYSQTWAQENPERYRAIVARTVEKNREQIRERKRQYYAENRERLIAKQRVCDLRRFEEKREYNRLYQVQYRDPQYHRAYKLKRLYGLSLAEYERMLAEQGGVCAICGLDDTARTRNGTPRLRVDHNHLTGRIRGLLCHLCNTRVGTIESHEWLAKANAYLKRYV
jgi:hypothetical protein